MVSQKTLQERAYNYLKEKIEAGELQAGQIYSETKMAQELQISRTPFKDALVRLSQDKYIDIIPSRGFRLHEITKQDILDTCQIRTAIEGFCAIELLRRQHTSSGRLMLRRMSRIMDKMQELIDQPQALETFVRLDTQFHALLVEFSGNSEFDKLFGSYMHQISTLAGASLLKPHRIQETLDEHQAILNAIVDEDTLACYRAVEKHMLSSMKINLERWEQAEG